jgi:hypothetical protein
MVCYEWNLKVNKIQSFTRFTSEDGKVSFLVPMNFRFTSTSCFDLFGAQNSILYRKLKTSRWYNPKNTHPRYRHKFLFPLAFTMHPAFKFFSYVFRKAKDSKIFFLLPLPLISPSSFHGEGFTLKGTGGEVLFGGMTNGLESFSFSPGDKLSGLLRQGGVNVNP